MAATGHTAAAEAACSPAMQLPDVPGREDFSLEGQVHAARVLVLRQMVRLKDARPPGRPRRVFSTGSRDWCTAKEPDDASALQPAQSNVCLLRSSSNHRNFEDFSWLSLFKTKNGIRLSIPLAVWGFAISGLARVFRCLFMRN